MTEIKVGNVKLVYEVHGNGPPVVNINGTGVAAAQWWQLGLGQKLLDAGYQVITFDNRGIAPSDVPTPPYTVSQMAQDTIGLLEYLECSPYILIGASLGGLITQTVALQRPELVRSAVFVIGCGNIAPFSRLIMRSMVEVLEKGDHSKSILATLLLPTFITPTQWADQTAIDSAIELITVFLPPDPVGLLGQLEADLRWSSEDHVEELTNLKMPSLVIAHEYCSVFPPVLAKEAASRMPNSEYIEIKGAAHVTRIPEHQKKRDSAILQFLSRYSPS